MARGGRNELDHLQDWSRAIAKLKNQFYKCKEALKEHIDPLFPGY
jgi:hypothetical protein